MPGFKWDDLPEAQPSSGGAQFDWGSHEEVAGEPVSMLESAARGAAQGASLGFADEVTGAAEAALDWAKSDPASFMENYKKHRDESRANYESAEKANPITSTVGQVGGSLATALVPGLNVAKGAGLAKTAANAALQGGIAGAGISNADSLSGIAQDTAEGAALGGVLGGALHGGVDLASKYSGQIKEAVPAVLGKAGQLATGADSEALARQFQRPAQTAAAEADNFAHGLSQRVGDEVSARTAKLGQDVGTAGRNFMDDMGSKEFDTRHIADSIGEFLGANEPSPKGFAAITREQAKELEKIQNLLNQGSTGEDIYKLRQYMDHVENLAGKYDKEGTSPFVRQLKQIRSQADQVIDSADPRVDSANKAYSQLMGDKALLKGATNESTAEGFVNNLYGGANKGAKQAAAENLLGVHPELLEQMKDLAANKAVGAANRPGGQNYFRHGALAALTFGASELITRPDFWKHGLRGLGNMGQKLGKYGPVLESAAKRGGNSLAATHFMLQQTDPGYQKSIQAINGEEEDQ